MECVDLGPVPHHLAENADRVAVMYLGHLVEVEIGAAVNYIETTCP